MSAAALALRSAAHARLVGDATLTGLLGGARVHDGVPRAAPLPCLALGPVDSRPLLADPQEGEEHRMEITALSRRDSRGEALSILARATALLADRAGLAAVLTGHRLVGVRLVETRVEPLAGARSGGGFQARARLRLVTEPAG